MGKDYKGLSNQLRRFRRLTGFSQRDIAHCLGVTHASIISRWEKGLSFPSLENVLKLSVLYHCLIDELYFDLRQKIKQELKEKMKNK